jgi:tetratricopeptide (TPR) repeat protein
MSTASATHATPVIPNPVDENTLLVEFERRHMPKDYREYYATKRNNFFASIEGFKELWELYLRLDAIWFRENADLKVATDTSRVFPLLLYFNAHAKIRIAMELAFTGCMSEARSILRDAVEFVAHAHWMLTDPDLQKTWLSKNDNETALKAFKDAFEHAKKDRVFKGLDELHKTWGELSETGSHANINATVDRFVQVTDDKNIEFRLNYTGVENQQLWGMMIFTMLLTCSTMENVFFSDYEDRLKLDVDLMRMRGECDRYKEHLRQTLIARYRLEPPGGIHTAPRPTIFRP